MKYIEDKSDWDSKSSNDPWHELDSSYLIMIITMIIFHIYSGIQGIVFLMLFPWNWWKLIRTYRRHQNVMNVIHEERLNRSSIIQNNQNNPEIPYQEHPNPERRLLEENQQLNPNEMRAAQFLDFVVEIRQRGIPFNTDLLRRTTAEERQNMVTSNCSICYFELNEDPNERLVYLPCNQNHVFHEMCILMWLENNRSWPVWEIVITQEDVERYSRNA